MNIMDEVHGHYTALVESLFQHLKDKLETWKITDKDWEQWTVLPERKSLPMIGAVAITLAWKA
jgi:lipoate-protein ligase A